MKLVLALVCALLPAAAQMGPDPGRWFGTVPELQRYLELTPEQVAGIVSRNAALIEFNLEKSRRAAVVQGEIGQETAKTQLDPMALGVRYLELEAIRRELAGRSQRTYEEIQALLTPAQKTKVQALVEAMRLQPVICEAQAANVLPSSAGAWIRTGDFLPVGGTGTGFASFLLGTPGMRPACSPAVPAITFRPGAVQQP